MKSLILNPIARIVIGLVGLLTSVVLFATFTGLLPDQFNNAVAERERTCESIAISFSLMANKVDQSSLEFYLKQVKARHPDCLSLGIRSKEGQGLLEIGDHFANWDVLQNEQSTAEQISLPIYAQGNAWGFMEMRFRPVVSEGVWGFFERTDVRLSLFIGFFSAIAFYTYLRFVLSQLNPSRVIPNRVRNALDTLAEGLAIIDRRERIVLANQAFQDSVGNTLENMIGKSIDDLGLLFSDEQNAVAPWTEALRSQKSVTGKLMTIKTDDGQTVVFSVSCGPILDSKQKIQGVITSFEDVTQLEKKKAQLEQMLFELDKSANEIRRQNQELEFLATRDPLTGSMNRRSYFEKFDSYFENAINTGDSLSAFMVDIDHFKSINDNHGHAMGDEVLKQVAATLESNVRSTDVVCRYGGEEFSVLLPDTTIDVAAEVAEKIREAIESLCPEGLSISASLGVSATCQNPETPQDLLEHADKCLYVAKRNGRNQVVRWDKTSQDVEIDESKISRTADDKKGTEAKSQIPFHAVTALISALAYRDQGAANHSRRVADLCVAVAEGLLPMRSCYLLEIAGLLHDIGKLGIPDSILNKPDELTDEEWIIVRRHERFGRELIHTSFGNAELDSIVGGYFLPHSQRILEKRDIPVAARILKIVDAFDSMTFDKPYRKGMSQWDAFAELRKYAGVQFDTDLVERVIHVIKLSRKTGEAKPVPLSKSAALSIGLQLERLARALDERDKKGIATIANHIQESASRDGATAISQKARELASDISEDEDLYEVIRGTNELMDLCRSAQRVLLSRDDSKQDDISNIHIDAI